MRSKTAPILLGLAGLLVLTGANGGATAASTGTEIDGVVVSGAEGSPAVTVSLIDQIPEAPPESENRRAQARDGVARRTPPPPPPAEPAPEPEPVPEPAPAPAPEPEPAPVPAAAPGSVGEIIARHFGGAAATATRIAQCESGLHPGAVSPGGGNHGLFQINNVHRGTFESVTGAPWSAVYDAEANTIFAKWLHDQQGWGPWACA